MTHVRNRFCERLFQWVSTAAFLVLLPAVALGEPPAKVDFDIPAQSLESALQQVARTQRVQILFSENDVKGVSTAGVKGALSTFEAVQKLVEGTGLVAIANQNNAIAIKPAVSNSRGGQAGNPTLLAQAQSEMNRAGASDSKDAVIGDNEASRRSEDHARPGPQKVEKIEVTGTHVRGVQEVAAQLITITRENISKTGASSLPDVFRTLPQNLMEISPAASFATGTSRIASENTQGATGISLRGLGPESTLVLLNGKRLPGNALGRIADISAIPLSVVERIEIVTGGRSAIYGSDAVAGVVNIVTRQTVQGAESQVFYGARQHKGGERLQASQILGHDFENGGFVVTLDYAKERALDAVDAGVGRGPSPFGYQPVPGAFDIIPDSHRTSGFVSGHLELGDRVEIFGSALYSAIRNQNTTAFELPNVFVSSTTYQNATDQTSLTGGARVELGSAWRMELSGVYGLVSSHETFDQGSGPVASDPRATQESLSFVADGPLRLFGSADQKAALGAEVRKESLKSTGSTQADRSRNINSIFGELVVPIVTDNKQIGLRLLELSIAGRYDSYSDFGNTTNPQVGLLWHPDPSVTVRSSYSKAFRAPSLFYLGFGNQALLQQIPDPASPGGRSPTLTWYGGNPELQPEKATTRSIGFDFKPTTSRWPRLSLSYFDIDYRNRIDQPATDASTALASQGAYSQIINRAPSSAQLASIIGNSQFLNFSGSAFNPLTQNILSVFPNLVFIDNRRSNVADDKVSGLDFAISTEFESSAGAISVGFQGTHYFKLDRRVTAQAPSQSQLNQQGKPVDLRLRANAGWTQGLWGVNAYLNYVDNYKDTLASPPGSIAAWSTVDLSLRFDGSRLKSGLFAGVVATLSVDNVLDKQVPAFASNLLGLGYDPANASPIGRFISFRLVRSW